MSPLPVGRVDFSVPVSGYAIPCFAITSAVRKARIRLSTLLLDWAGIANGRIGGGDSHWERELLGHQKSPCQDECKHDQTISPMQGQTYFAATGDYGSPQNPGNNVEDDFYPSDDAWVTAVSMSLVFTTDAGGPWASEIYAGGSGGGY